MVVVSTILNLRCYMDTMTNEPYTYRMPNLGCLLGTAYQCQLRKLAIALDGAGLGITTTEYLVLRALYASDGMQQCEISDLLGKDKGAVSRCISGLVRKGLVTTESVSHKCLRVFISSEGRAIEPKVLKVARQRHEDLSHLLTAEELAMFGKVLVKIIKEN